jgi:hypothetical protein
MARPRTQGYYEGAELLALIRWLASAAVECEAPLLTCLCSMPWPYKPPLVLMCAKAAAQAAAAVANVPEPTTPKGFSYWVGFATSAGGSEASASGAGGPAAPAIDALAGGPAAAGAAVAAFTPRQAGVQPMGARLAHGQQLPHEAQLMSPADMRRCRPNGYAGVVAPLLYGEAGEHGAGGTCAQAWCLRRCCWPAAAGCAAAGAVAVVMHGRFGKTTCRRPRWRCAGRPERQAAGGPGCVCARSAVLAGGPECGGAAAGQGVRRAAGACGALRLCCCMPAAS